MLKFIQLICYLTMTVVLLNGCDNDQTTEVPLISDLESAGIQITEARLNDAPKTAPTRAAYMTLVNNNDAPIRLVSASSKQFNAVEIHRMEMDGEMMQMRPVANVLIPAGEQVPFMPGGLHLMLKKRQSPLDEVVLVTLTFKASDGSSITQDIVLAQP